jgi:16S rRNA C967 or C1407 C5-methylase (RsmB/RsmF family)/NOL1/NOP2/fmu family ribosome biogenesis protein
LKIINSVLSADDVSKLVDALNKKPTISIRTNPEKRTQPATTAKVPWCADGFYLEERPSFTLDPLFHAGAYYVQEPSSMFLEQFIKISFGDSVEIKALDLCAAPGGKSTHLLSLLNKDCLVVSNEVIRSRANILSENIQKWGYANGLVTQNDPSHFNRITGYFDLIVVDAPCSGEGLFRKDHDAIREWSENNVQLCSKRQRRILSDIFPSLAQNGVMIYCTCTYNSLENEENLKWLKAQNDLEFIRIPQAKLWGIEEINKDGIIGYRFMPHRLQGEGYYISGFIKRNEAKTTITKNKLHTKSQSQSPKIPEEWIKDEELHFMMNNDGVNFYPKKWNTDIQLLSSMLHCIQIGTLAGTMKRDKFIPHHALALSTYLNKDLLQKVELNITDAIQYLRKESLLLDGYANGYTLITYLGLGLGWMNQLGHRANNLYPTQWRIKMRS